MSISEYFKKKKLKRFKKKYKVGLCLSGGGTRGFAHLGAFKAFEEYGIEFDAVAGASAGSLFGALYATKMKYEQMYKLSKNVKNSDFRKSKLGFLPSKMDNLQELIKKVMPVKKIEDLAIPYYAVAVDLKTGNEIHFNIIRPLDKIAYLSPNPGPIRYALECLGIETGLPILPVEPPTLAMKTQIKSTIEKIKNKINADLYNDELK